MVDSLSLRAHLIGSHYAQRRKSKKSKQRSDIQLSERLASLEIIGTQLKVPLKPLAPSQHYGIRDLRAHLIGSHYVQRRKSLGQLIGSFSSTEITYRVFRPTVLHFIGVYRLSIICIQLSIITNPVRTITNPIIGRNE